MQIISTYKPVALQFLPSQIFFEHQKTLLKTLQFFPHTSIDLYIKYSFQVIEESYFIKGADITSYDMDHNIQNQGIVYQIGLLSPKVCATSYREIDLKDLTSRVSNSILAYLKWFPVRQRIGFLLCIVILPGTVGTFLLNLNLIGIGIMLIISLYKTIKTFRNMFKTTKKVYKGFEISYQNEEDLAILSDEVLTFLPHLQEKHIEKIAYTGNCFYLYQTTTKTTSFFSKDIMLTEEEKAKLITETIRYIQNSDFLSFVQS